MTFYIANKYILNNIFWPNGFITEYKLEFALGCSQQFWWEHTCQGSVTGKATLFTFPYSTLKPTCFQNKGQIMFFFSFHELFKRLRNL